MQKFTRQKSTNFRWEQYKPFINHLCLAGLIIKKEIYEKEIANSFQQAETSRNQVESRLHLIKSSHLRYALRWGSITLKPFKDKMLEAAKQEKNNV